MGNTTGRGLHVDQHLTNVAINFRPPDLIADMIAPVVTVDKETNTYPVFSQKELLSIESTLRARGAEANKITRSVGSSQYVCKNYALGYDVPIEDVANMDAAFRYELEEGAAKYLVSKLGIDMEKRVLDLANSAANVSSTFVANSSWNGSGSPGDPVNAIGKMIEQVQSMTGYKPNSILAGWRAHQAMLRNPNMRNFINGLNNGGGMASRDRIRDAFEMDRYLVSNVFYSAQNENVPVSSLSLTSPIADKVFVYYAPLSASRDDPSWMYSFRWQAPGLPAPMVVERHAFDSRRKVQGIECGYYQDERVTGAAFAAAINALTSSGSIGI